jgi:hypothetical protein
MNNLPLFDSERHLPFRGSDYVTILDAPRLTKQHERIRDLMLDGKHRTLSEIARATGDHEASISAQLRHLRKDDFGGFVVSKRRRGEGKQGLWEYQVTK